MSSSKSYGGVGPGVEKKLFSQSMNSLEQGSLLSMGTSSNSSANSLKPLNVNPSLNELFQKAQAAYNAGAYTDCLSISEKIYDSSGGPTVDGAAGMIAAIGGTHRTDNLLLMGAAHFQLRNFSESVFYNQQCIRVDPSFSEAYSNLGNALKELGDLKGATQFYLKAIKLKPRFCDAYNNLASAYMLQAQPQQAMETYQMALVLNPGLVDAHANLGNLHKSNGDLEAAKKCYLEAIRIKPDFAIAWNNLAGVFKEEGQTGTAVAYYGEAIRLCPEFADAHSNLGNALKEQGQLQDAIQSYQVAIKLRPDFAIAHGNLGSCYYDLGDFTSAIKSFNYAIQLEPNFPDAYNNLGNALKEEKKLDEAINAYRSALHLKQDHPHAYNNMGNAMIEKGYVKEAIHCFVTAIRLMPKFSAAHSNLASVFKEQGKLDQAVAHYTEAIQIDPAFADAYSNLGNTYKDAGQSEQAIKCYHTAIQLEPNYAEAYSNLAAVMKDTGNTVEAIQLYRKALSLKPNFPEAISNLIHTKVFICDWTSRDEDFQQLRDLLVSQLSAAPTTVPSIQPFHTVAYPFSLQEALQISKRYAHRCRRNVSLVGEQNFKRAQKVKSDRIKVGYVSSDFGNHPLSQLMQTVFGRHDESKFEVFLYALSPSDGSDYRLNIEAEVEHLIDISDMHAHDAAKVINSHGIHVLVNLNGYTQGAKNEIFALRPAAVQIAYMGFCGTMGAEWIDYIIADRTVIPPELTVFYQEKVIYMPHSYFVNSHRQSCKDLVDLPEGTVTRAQYGISDDKFVFCNFNQLYKMDPVIFDCWMRILKRVPNAVLWLLRFPALGEENIRREARERGVRDDQLVFTDVASREEHIKRGFLADLFLDTPQCNAHTTCCDILWSGTPMITMKGEKMASRVAASILGATGLGDELVCDSYEEYEALGVALAEDSDRLYSMRQHLENSRNTCAAFDTTRWVRNVEQAYTQAVFRCERGLPPDHLSVEDDAPVFTEGGPSLL